MPGRQIFDIGLCPTPGVRKGKEWRSPVAMSESYDEETNRLTVTIGIMPTGRIVPDRIYTLFLCPEGMSCACDYSVSLEWQITDHCMAVFVWTWPEDAG
jgi:hypothetical protein